MRPLYFSASPHPACACSLPLAFLSSSSSHQMGANPCRCGLTLAFVPPFPPPLLLYSHLLLALRWLLNCLPHENMRSKDAVGLRSEGRALLQRGRICSDRLPLPAFELVGVGRLVQLRIVA